MAPWYDNFWKDYLDKTLVIPLQLVTAALTDVRFQKKMDYEVQQLGQLQQQQQQQQDQHQEDNDGEKEPFLTLVDVGCGTGEFLWRIVHYDDRASENSDKSSSNQEQTDKKNTVTTIPVWPTTISLSRTKLIGIDASPEMLQQASSKFQQQQLQQQQQQVVDSRGRQLGGIRQEDQSSFQPPSPIPRWIHSNAEHLSYLDDESVDVICSTSAFHFFQDQYKSVQEMYRVLKPNPIGTSLIITDWSADYWLVRLYHSMELLRWSWSYWYDTIWNTTKRFSLWTKSKTTKTNQNSEKFEHDRRLFRHPIIDYPGPLYSHELKRLVEDVGFVDVSISTYTVRVWYFFWWGMQTITARKA
jgi:ubiquinone/menaquinone biosynthesis C-methylase UbiE